MSHILAQRLQQIDEMRDEYRKAGSESDKAAHRAALVQRIRDFFGLR
jgi:hypothetical protein